MKKIYQLERNMNYFILQLSEFFFYRIFFFFDPKCFCCLNSMLVFSFSTLSAQGDIKCRLGQKRKPVAIIQSKSDKSVCFKEKNTLNFSTFSLNQSRENIFLQNKSLRVQVSFLSFSLLLYLWPFRLIWNEKLSFRVINFDYSSQLLNLFSKKFLV